MGRVTCVSPLRSVLRRGGLNGTWHRRGLRLPAYLRTRQLPPLSVLSRSSRCMRRRFSARRLCGDSRIKPITIACGPLPLPSARRQRDFLGNPIVLLEYRKPNRSVLRREGSRKPSAKIAEPNITRISKPYFSFVFVLMRAYSGVSSPPSPSFLIHGSNKSDPVPRPERLGRNRVRQWSFVPIWQLVPPTSGFSSIVLLTSLEICLPWAQLLLYQGLSYWDPSTLTFRKKRVYFSFFCIFVRFC